VDHYSTPPPHSPTARVRQGYQLISNWSSGLKGSAQNTSKNKRSILGARRIHDYAIQAHSSHTSLEHSTIHATVLLSTPDQLQDEEKQVDDVEVQNQHCEHVIVELDLHGQQQTRVGQR
jgi:hypothetical protein